jgi:DNA-binding response OmpR family regulator
MIVIVQDGRSTSPVAARLDRLGVANSVLSPAQTAVWLGTAGRSEREALEAVLATRTASMAEAVTAIRGGCRCPLIVLSDDGAAEWRLSILAAGADDLIPTDTDAREIMARVAAVARRGQFAAGIPSAPLPADIMVFPDGRDPLVAGTALDLPRRERRILECLARNRGAWTTKAQLFNEVYGLFNDGLEETVVESHICRLRNRLAARLGYIPIRSQRHLGYRLELAPNDGGLAATQAIVTAAAGTSLQTMG